MKKRRNTLKKPALKFMSATWIVPKQLMLH